MTRLQRRERAPLDLPGISEPAWRDGVHAVRRTRDQIRRAYDRASLWYGLVEEPLELRARLTGVRLLAPEPGAHILEVGCGTGVALVELAHSVGPTGHITGVDISASMAERAADRVDRAAPDALVDVRIADAACLPWPDGTFDAIFSSFTLDLFETPEIPVVLAEWRRVVRPGGRIVVVSLSRADPVDWATRAYEWVHDRVPAVVDCRPIHPARALEAVGLRGVQRIPVPLFGLRVEAAVGTA